MHRLKLTNAKLDTLVAGIRSIAEQTEPLGKLLTHMEIADQLNLSRVSCSIGVILIIFESRPDCLPQIIALALRSGNGLVLKGGKEAERSNNLLHRLIVETIESATQNRVSGNLVGLVTTRSEIPSLLELDDVIDLCIPRGSASLVRYIKEHTKIPVMGHADGICHLYVDEFADVNKAVRIAVDSKTDYPSACNALETLLLNEATLSNGTAEKVLEALRQKGVSILGSERAIELGLASERVFQFSMEYGDLTLAVEIVSSVEAAIDHIHQYGSGHTDSIVTEDAQIAEKFVSTVDSACVFHNASTRFADGYRFGLGAEVGVSTSRIDPRGPVGVEGIMASKWILKSASERGHTASSFAANTSDGPQEHYTFRQLPL